MSELLSFDNAVIAEGKVGPSYLTVGNHKVKVTEVKKGNNPTKGTPCLDITVEDEVGAICTQRYTLTATVAEGKQTSAWAIASSAILMLVAAANKLDEAGAKTKLAGLSLDNIDTKLSSLLVGKMFSINLKGEHIPNKDVTKDSWIKVEFGGFKFADTLENFDKMPKTPYIKGIPVKGSSDTVGNTGKAVSDLPW